MAARSGADAGGGLFACRLTDSLSQTLGRKLSRFSLAPDGFDPNAPTTLAIGRHDFSVTIGQDEQVTSYISKVFDPDAATLAPGVYDFSVDFNGQSKDLSITVGADWNWTDVLNAVAGRINAQAAYASTGDLMGSGGFSLPGLTANAAKADLASQTQSGVFTDGRILTIETAAPFACASLTLTGGDQGLLPPWADHEASENAPFRHRRKGLDLGRRDERRWFGRGHDLREVVRGDGRRTVAVVRGGRQDAVS